MQRPARNSSCILLANIGPKRADLYEAENAGAATDSLDSGRLPCRSERSTFMSPLGYSVTKTHPCSFNPALKGTLHDTVVTLPGYAFEALPFRWLNRETPRGRDRPRPRAGVQPGSRGACERRSEVRARLGHGRRQPARGHRRLLRVGDAAGVPGLHVPQALPWPAIARFRASRALTSKFEKLN